MHYLPYTKVYRCKYILHVNIHGRRYKGVSRYPTISELSDWRAVAVWLITDVAEVTDMTTLQNRFFDCDVGNVRYGDLERIL